MSEENKKHRKEIEEKVEDAKKSVKVSPRICILIARSSIGHLHVFTYPALEFLLCVLCLSDCSVSSIQLPSGSFSVQFFSFHIRQYSIYIKYLSIMCNISRCVLLTWWQKLHTLSRPTWTYEAMRRSSTLSLEEEWWTLRRIVYDPKGNLLISEVWIEAVFTITCKCVLWAHMSENPIASYES